MWGFLFLKKGFHLWHILLLFCWIPPKLVSGSQAIRMYCRMFLGVGVNLHEKDTLVLIKSSLPSATPTGHCLINSVTCIPPTCIALPGLDSDILVKLLYRNLLLKSPIMAMSLRNRDFLVWVCPSLSSQSVWLKHFLRQPIWKLTCFVTYNILVYQREIMTSDNTLEQLFFNEL